MHKSESLNRATEADAEELIDLSRARNQAFGNKTLRLVELYKRREELLEKIAKLDAELRAAGVNPDEPDEPNKSEATNYPEVPLVVVGKKVNKNRGFRKFIATTLVGLAAIFSVGIFSGSTPNKNKKNVAMTNPVAAEATVNFDEYSHDIISSSKTVEVPTYYAGEITDDSTVGVVENTLSEAEPEAESEPEIASELISESTVETEVAPEAVPEVASAPEAAPEMTLEAVSGTTPEAAPETTPEVMPEVIPETPPEAVPEVVSEVVSESEITPELSMASEAAPEAMPEPEAVPEATPELSVASEAEAVSEPEPAPEVVSEPEVAPEAFSEPETTPEAAPEAAPEPEVTTGSDTPLESAPESTPEPAPAPQAGPVLNARNGRIQGPSGEETYYNLNMNRVVSNMHNMGFEGEYWVRDDGVKMFGDYVMVAANLDVHPRGSLVETSLGTGIVCDTGRFAKTNHHQLDIATSW
ncbi:hypothetical protein IJG27_02595 [Candidatus Saccharibacteria bacterium]|nr:hypothetical protein [Candidatus Saccharibacteria bacterium]